MKVRTINSRFTTALLKTQDKGSYLDLSSFDLLVDCTDNATTRYLLSDLAVQNQVTLVSGGAVGLEGWVGVWNLPGRQENDSSLQSSNESDAKPRGPCLRCIYPQSQKDNSGNCEDDGILGTVVGTIGVLMANEAIKLLVGLHGETKLPLNPLATEAKCFALAELKPIMTLFSPLSTPMFRNVKLRGRKPGCLGCDQAALPALEKQESAFTCAVEEQGGDTRVSARSLQEAMQAGKPYILIDTRPEVEYGICSLPGSLSAFFSCSSCSFNV